MTTPKRTAVQRCETQILLREAEEKALGAVILEAKVTRRCWQQYRGDLERELAILKQEEKEAGE